MFASQPVMEIPRTTKTRAHLYDSNWESMAFGKLILAAERATVVKRSTDTQVGTKAVAIDNIRLLKIHSPAGFGWWNMHQSSDELPLMHIAQMPGPVQFRECNQRAWMPSKTSKEKARAKE